MGAKRIFQRIADGELALSAALAPFLMFPALSPYLTAAAALGVAVLWFARWIARGAVTRRTPLDGLMLLVMAMLPVAMWASPMPEQSATAACRVLLGIALYFALVNTVTDARALRRTLWIALAGGVAIALAGLVTTDWNADKIPLLEPIYPLLPNLSHLLGPLASEQDSTPGAFHPNLIGAALAVLLPVTAALFVTSRLRAARAAIGAGALIMALVLALTQSRLGMASLIVASGVTAWRLKPRWRRWVVGLVTLAGLAVVLAGPGRVVSALTANLSAQGFGSWESRVVVWQGALHVLADFPYTGIGLSTFYPAATYLYAFDVSPTWAFGHTHQTYLQMGVDFGWVGLIAFVGMLIVALQIGWPGRNAPAGAERTVRAGIWTSLLTYALFGVFDGLPLWTKPGFVIWVLLAWVMIGAGRVRGANGSLAAGEAIDAA